MNIALFSNVRKLGWCLNYYKENSKILKFQIISADDSPKNKKKTKKLPNLIKFKFRCSGDTLLDLMENAERRTCGYHKKQDFLLLFCFELLSSQLVSNRRVAVWCDGGLFTLRG